MSVSLNPSSSLGFKRPLTQLVKRSLTITNHNTQPIAFKVKTTAPKVRESSGVTTASDIVVQLYCVRPNSGRVEPGESLDVSVMLQALKDEPPMNAKCKDKFLIQSTLITAEKETMNLADIWNVADTTEEGKVHQQKLRVTFLPAEGQTLEEEEEPQPNVHDISHQQPIANGHAQRILDFNQPPPHELQPQDMSAPRSLTPTADISATHVEPRDVVHEVPIVHVTGASDPLPASPAPPTEPHPAPAESDELEDVPEPLPAPIPVPVLAVAEKAFVPQEPEPEPEPEPAPISVPIQEPYNFELVAKYEEAQHEIQRLRSLLENLQSEPAVSEIRRRRPALSDDGMSVAETELQTAYGDDNGFVQQEGVPLQVVAIIALGVFITTYLFF
ncbi:hypothetical protein H0H87_008721 [Tephrocybe sp. NHM501043]|nr:hypothetical protein H0H87_008721 [Tephrocybe sp. NHM501043]